MKHYLINTSVDWCDEFDFAIVEIKRVLGKNIMPDNRKYKEIISMSKTERKQK